MKASYKKVPDLYDTLMKYSTGISQLTRQGRQKKLQVILEVSNSLLELTEQFGVLALCRSLISNHSSTLKSISINATGLKFSNEDLQNCKVLKELSLVHVPFSFPNPGEDDDRIRLPTTLQCFLWTVDITPAHSHLHPDNFLFTLNAIFEVMKDGIEELILIADANNPHFRMLFLNIDWIPRSLPKIKQIVIADIDEDEVEPLTNHCENHARPISFYVKKRKDGKNGFCITAIA